MIDFESKYEGAEVEAMLDSIGDKQEKITDLEAIRDGASKGATALQSIPSDYVTESELNSKGYATTSELNNKADKSSLSTVATSGRYTDLYGRPTLAAVATSGLYDDLSNKPTIPAAVTESTVSGWGFTKNTGTYSKPNGGIPKTDLDGEVQGYLEQAATSVPFVQYGERNFANAVDGFMDQDQYVYALPNLADGSEDDVIATANTLKTINGQSLLGEGNITIKGGEGGGSYDDTAIKKELAKKANIDGVYKDMTVGRAANILGIDEGQEAKFTFRPTDGDGSITDCLAEIESIKGNTVVWNQEFPEFSSALYLTNDSRTSFTFSGTIANGVYLSSGLAYLSLRKANSIINHIYYISAEIYVPKAADIKLGWYGGQTSCGTAAAGSRARYSVITKATKADSALVGFTPDGSWTRGNTFSISDIRCVDLTKMFGIGNEPTSVEEFNARCPKGILLSEYNEGELINMKVDGIKSVGFNAFDGDAALVVGGKQYYLGGEYEAIDFDGTDIVIPSDRLYTPPYNGYIYAEGTDICINLAHTGYRNGEYEPYEEDTLDLSIIAQAFPDGMRKAGAAYDEICRGKNGLVKVQRVAEVDCGTLNWYVADASEGAKRFKARIANVKSVSSASVQGNIICSKYDAVTADKARQGNKGVAIEVSQEVSIYDDTYTDASAFKNAVSGVMLYYELAEPIVTELADDVNLQYQAWDFGTEEALAITATTPFSGSIIYDFNARDTIRANKRNIEELSKYVDVSIAKAITNVLNTEV